LTDAVPDARAPAIILVEPQLGENIGAAARAMLNCGLTELRLVRPRDGWPNPKAQAAASGADRVLDSVSLFDQTTEAIADLNYVVATTARRRDMVKPVFTPAAAAAELRSRAAAGQRCGILFGPERTGLFNDDIPLADSILTVPLNPEFSSLNVAQAVLLVVHAWYSAGDGTPGLELPTGSSRPATKGELDNLFRHLEAELESGGFFTSAEQAPSMTRNLRNMLQRAGMTEQEIRTFHGVITALVMKRRPSSGS
jgi:tRNA/rRNA methyltransferase